LFSMAVGMSVPLLIIGVSAGSLLPRAGTWMETVKRLFGVLMLGVALWMISPVIPAWLQMAGWAALGVGYGAWLLRGPGMVGKLAGLAFLLAGAAQVAGLASGARDPLAPLARLRGGHAQETAFQRIKSPADLDAALAAAKGKPVLLDFYADWCVSCKEMEKLTFSDARVKERFAGMLLLQADVTANDADDRALLKRFRLFGPPGIILFGGNAAEAGRVIGYQDADSFLRSLAPVSGG
jgi:thiol:disulfide interchange protein DsbD